MPCCVAINCSNRSDRDRDGITFHKFPTKDQKLRDQWVAALKREDFKPSVYSVLCSKHFLETEIDRSSPNGRIRIKNGVVPSVFDVFPGQKASKSKLQKKQDHSMWHFKSELYPTLEPMSDTEINVNHIEHPNKPTSAGSGSKRKRHEKTTTLTTTSIEHDLKDQLKIFNSVREHGTRSRSKRQKQEESISEAKLNATQNPHPYTKQHESTYEADPAQKPPAQSEHKAQEVPKSTLENEAYPEEDLNRTTSQVEGQSQGQDGESTSRLYYDCRDHLYCYNFARKPYTYPRSKRQNPGETEEPESTPVLQVNITDNPYLVKQEIPEPTPESEVVINEKPDFQDHMYISTSLTTNTNNNTDDKILENFQLMRQMLVSSRKKIRTLTQSVRRLKMKNTELENVIAGLRKSCVEVLETPFLKDLFKSQFSKATVETDKMQASSTLDTKHILSHYDPAVLQMHKALKTAEESGAGSEVVEAIKKALELVDAREEFCETLTSPESEPCKNIMDASYAHDWKTLKAEGKTKWNLTPRMLTGHLAGQFLKSVVSISNAKRILEIGMYTGYSALAMAEALPADGEVVTVDQEKYLESFTGDLVSKSPHGSKIKIHIGSAIDYMKKAAEAGEKFDLIFLDADKSEYWDYLTIAMNGGLLNARGTILVDNTFRHGAGYMKEAGENSTKQFAESCIADKSLHKCLVPMRDGVCMIRRVADVEGAPAK